MTYSFNLDETDYLVHQLFVASTSKTTIAKRRRSWVITTVTFLIFAGLFERTADEFLRNYFLVAAVICAIFYPLYSRWRYKKHYRKHVNTNHANSFGQTGYVKFLKEYILTKDDSNSESKISHSQIESINQLPDHFLIRLKGGQSLILPKQKIDQLNELRSELLVLGNRVGLELADYTNWRWK